LRNWDATTLTTFANATSLIVKLLVRLLAYFLPLSAKKSIDLALVKVKSILGWLSLGAFSAALFACGGSNESNTQAKRPVGVGDTGAANAKLERIVREKLDADAQLKAAGLEVEADVTRNEMTLSGAVASEALREKAVEAAKTAQVGILVNDRIRVQRSAPEREPSSPQ
jgi:hypothetical protein